MRTARHAHTTWTQNTKWLPNRAASHFPKHSPLPVKSVSAAIVSHHDITLTTQQPAYDHR